MNTNILIVAATVLLTPMLACDVAEEYEPIAHEFRDEPQEFWQTVMCFDGTFSCWGLHPATSDAWTRVRTWNELQQQVDVGRLKEDLVGGFGPLSCAPGKFPDSVPKVRCYRLVGTVDNVCYGGGTNWAAEIKPSCGVPGGYDADHYVAVGCTWDLGDVEAPVQLFGHVTKIEAGLLLEGNGGMLIAPSCHVLD
jgi:hypothetical protein